MVNQIDRAGFRDWVIQRITAIIVGAYTIFLAAYILLNQPMYYAQWHKLFSHMIMKMSTFIVVIAILWHAWLGLWTVFTDYVKPKVVRLILETIVVLLFLSYLLWTFEILRL